MTNITLLTIVTSLWDQKNADNVERDDVQGKIINAARDLFVTEGVESVSMRKIADAVEYSPTVIYQYFADKEALLHEICSEDFATLAETFQELAKIEDPLKRI